MTPNPAKPEDVITDANNLYRAYKASIKGSKWKNSSQKFMMNHLKYIFRLREELKARTLKNGPVTEFSLSERGRVRPISSIPIKDRIVRHVLCDELLMPAIKRRIIYDNCASIKGRGMAMQRKRFEVHLNKYYQKYGNEGYILFGDFSKFYDNILHEKAKEQFLKLFDGDEFMKWLLDLIFEGFEVDVSGMTEEEQRRCIDGVFNKLEYRKEVNGQGTGDKRMKKSANIGDQLSQDIGIFYTNRIDTYVKYVRSQKFYGRYMDDWYVMNPDKGELADILKNVREIAGELGIHINDKKTRVVKISGTYKFLQVKYSLTKDGKVIKRINPERVTAMRRKLKKLAAKVKTGEIPYESAEQMFKSWMGSFYKLLSKDQRKGLIKLYEDLFDKTIKIENKKMVIDDRMEEHNGGTVDTDNNYDSRLGNGIVWTVGVYHEKVGNKGHKDRNADRSGT